MFALGTGEGGREGSQTTKLYWALNSVQLSGQYTLFGCTVCSVQCAVCSVQCAVCNVQCAVCSVQCAVCSVQCAVCSVQCSVCSIKCAVCTVQYAVNSVPYIALQGIRQESLPQVKLGKTLNLQLFGVFLTKIKVDPESWSKILSIKQLRTKNIPKDSLT